MNNLPVLIIILLLAYYASSPAQSPDTPLSILSNQSKNDILNKSVSDTQHTINGKTNTDVMVVKGSYSSREKSIQAHSSATFTAKDIKKTAGATDDISRYLGTMPSVVSGLQAKYDNPLYVRGGRSSEVLFFIDGLEFENINHFSEANGSGGPLGFINPDYIRKVNYYAGNSPASYPGRLSSVIDIDMKSGSQSGVHGSIGDKEIYGGLASIECPLPGKKGSLALAARYIDFTPYKGYLLDQGIPKLGDLFGKIFIPINKEMYLSATGIGAYNYCYLGYDYRLQDDNGRLYSNYMNTTQTIWQGGGGLSFHYKKANIEHQVYASITCRNSTGQDSLSVYPDSFSVTRYAKNPIALDKDFRNHINLHSQSIFTINDIHSLSLGYRINQTNYYFKANNQMHHEGNYTVCTPGGPQTYVLNTPPRENQLGFKGEEYGAFIDYNIVLGQLHSSIGMRADYYKLLDDITISPTISELFSLGEAGNIMASWGVYHQFPLDLPTIIFSNLLYEDRFSQEKKLSFEKQLLKEAKPLRCQQASIGYDILLFNAVQPKIEAFYKWYDREYYFVAPGYQDVYVLDPATGLPTLRPQTGLRKSYGVEASILSKTKSWYFYSLGGSIFEVKNKFADTKWYNDWTNVRYTYSLNGGITVFKDHSFSIGLQGAGARPYCKQAVSQPDCMGRTTIVYDSLSTYFNNYLDPLFSINVKYAFSHTFGPVRFEAYCELLNVTNYKPRIEILYNGEEFKPVYPFGFTPICGITLYF